MDKKDTILQLTCPTLMVPRYSVLPDIETGKGYRFLMAEDGLWIETRLEWGHFRKQLWKSERVLPYGQVSEIMYLVNGPIPKPLINECIERAIKHANKGVEWVGWITWSEDDGYEFTPVESTDATADHIAYICPTLPAQKKLVLNLHSHTFDLKKFSHIDDHDDIGGTHFSGVISIDSKYVPTITVRLCIEGFYWQQIGHI